MVRHKKGIKQRQPGTASHPLMRYEQVKGTITIGTSNASDDDGFTLFDTSVRTSNKNSKVGKMTIQWWTNLNEDNLFFVGVYKHKEGNAPEALDDVVAIRDMRSEGRLIRGPWMLSARGLGNDSANVRQTRKTIVLEDLLLDPNDDLMMSVTQQSATTGTNFVEMFVRTWWRVTE